MNYPQFLSLHLGAHKTASTHLQKSLQKHRKLMARNGVCFIGPRYLRKPEHGLSQLFSRREDTPFLSTETLAGLAEGAKRVVISEENALGAALSPMFESVLYPAADLRVEAALSDVDGVEVSLFLAMREPSDWLASMYRQRLWSGDWQDFNGFLGKHDPLVMKWSNLIDRLRRLEKVPQIFVWRYEDYPKVSGPVLRRMVGWRLGPRIPRIDGRVNEGLTEAVVNELVALKTPKPGEPKIQIKEVRERLKEAPQDNSFDPWPPGIREKSKQAYEADIAKLAEFDEVTLLKPSKRSSALGGNVT